MLPVSRCIHIVYIRRRKAQSFSEKRRKCINCVYRFEIQVEFGGLRPASPSVRAALGVRQSHRTGHPGVPSGEDRKPLDKSPQCRKWRMPVNTIAMPASSAALMTSSSRIDPPGWITAVAPASAATSSPSENGKNASEATTEPCQRLAPAAVRRRPAPWRRRCARIAAAHLAGADADGGSRPWHRRWRWI